MIILLGLLFHIVFQSYRQNPVTKDIRYHPRPFFRRPLIPRSGHILRWVCILDVCLGLHITLLGPRSPHGTLGGRESHLFNRPHIKGRVHNWHPLTVQHHA